MIYDEWRSNIIIPPFSSITMAKGARAAIVLAVANFQLCEAAQRQWDKGRRWWLLARIIPLAVITILPLL